MISILHTADWQWGAASMHPIFNTSLIPKLAGLARSEDCKYILVVGDIFDKPNPSQEHKDELIKQIADNFLCYKDITVILTAGNHDYLTKEKKYHSLKYMEVVKDVMHYVTLDPLRLHIVEPGNYRSFPDFDLFVLNDWKEPSQLPKSNPKKLLILAWHGIVPGMTFSNIKGSANRAYTEVQQLLDKTKASYIALGDIHQCLKLHDRCWYPGPPVQKTYADEDGVLVVKLDKTRIKIDKHQLDLPKRITLAVDFTEGKDTERSIVHFVKKKVRPGNLIKLKFEIPLSTWSALDKKYIRNQVKQHCLDFVMENDPIPEPKLRKNMLAIKAAKTIEEELAIIIQEEAFGLDAKKLETFCREYLHR